ncbi:MAG: CRISPR-associated endonuclease Cas2 [archaeon]
MRIILIYDVGEERVNRVYKTCKEYLTHIQNSVFEGDITESNLKELKMRLNEKIKKEHDSVIIFYLWSASYKKEVLGLEKNSDDNII